MRAERWLEVLWQQTEVEKGLGGVWGSMGKDRVNHCDGVKV